MAKSNKTPAAAASPGTALSKAEAIKGAMIDVKDYALIGDPESMEAVRYNLQGEQISEFDLDRVKVPAGGATVFQVPTLEGIKNVESIEGVVLLSQIRRAFWEDPNPSGLPPDCYSIDGINGQGDPGGDCATCPFNEFGSAVKPNGEQGRGKRCRERRTILILREEDRLPTVISAPPASIKVVKQLLMKLPVPMYRAVLRFSLVSDKNRDGTVYSKLAVEYVGYISDAAGKGLRRFAETMKGVLVGQAPPAADFEEAPPADNPNVIDGETSGSENLDG